MVQRVQTLGSILHFDAFGNRQVLDERKVPARLTVASNPAETQRRDANVAGERLRRVAIEAAHVEPVIDAALVLRQHDIVRIAREQCPDIAETKRRPTLALHYAVQLPSARNE